MLLGMQTYLRTEETVLVLFTSELRGKTEVFFKKHCEAQFGIVSRYGSGWISLSTINLQMPVEFVRL